MPMIQMSSGKIRQANLALAPGQQAGFGLIEVLVTVLILGIGILGVASTQIVSLKVNSQSQSRSQAVLLAEDILDRIRASYNDVDAYALAQGNAQGAANGACSTSFVPANGSVPANDIATWENNLACVLPAAERSVVVNGNTVTVTINWDQDDPNMNPVVVRTQI